jgi:hypothetical protein
MLRCARSGYTNYCICAISDVFPNRILCAGSLFVKITKSGEPLERLIYLTEDNRFLRWNSNFWAFKSQKQKQIDVHSIKRVQKGQLTAKFARWQSVLRVAAPRSFSIIYGDDLRTLDLIASTEEELQQWYRALKHLKHSDHEAADMDPFEAYVQSHFEAACVSAGPGGNAIDTQNGGFRHVLGNMNCALSAKDADALVMHVCGSLKPQLLEKDFKDIMQFCRRR